MMIPIEGRRPHRESRAAVTEACHMVPLLLGWYHLPDEEQGAAITNTSKPETNTPKSAAIFHSFRK